MLGNRYTDVALPAYAEWLIPNVNIEIAYD